MQVAPSTYYAARARPPSARSVTDAQLSEVITVEHAANYGVYGARKMRRHLHRLGQPFARCTVERLMRAGGLHGAVRGRAKRTTIPGKDGVRAGGPGQPGVHRDRAEPAVGRGLHLRADLVGFAYVAFVIDVFSRMIVGWKADTNMRATLVTDTLEMAAWARGRAGVTDLTGLIHHSDAGSQYVSLALTERLAALGIRASIGTVADAYDNAMAESTIGLFKTELIRRRGPWTTSRSRPWSGSTGSTTAACTPNSATSHPPSTRPTTTVTTPRRERWRPKNRASTESRAVHCPFLRRVMHDEDVGALPSAPGRAPARAQSLVVFAGVAVMALEGWASTAIWRGLASSATGMLKVRTPSAYEALIASRSKPLPTVSWRA